ncbi:MAG: hypothetical protein JWR07_3036 [Nevskia sp.]|nr:hypothetical protein [Nevskia sp.]
MVRTMVQSMVKARWRAPGVLLNSSAMNRAIALLLLCSLPLAASAQIYKWTDANGQVHFSQNPPKEGNFQNVTPQGPVSGATSGSAAPAKRRQSASAATTNDTVLQAKADNEERCAKARERISFLQEKTAHRLFVTGDDGQPARMTDDQFDQQLQDAQDAASKYCS